MIIYKSLDQSGLDKEIMRLEMKGFFFCKDPDDIGSIVLRVSGIH